MNLLMSILIWILKKVYGQKTIDKTIIKLLNASVDSKKTPYAHGDQVWRRLRRRLNKQ